MIRDWFRRRAVILQRSPQTKPVLRALDIIAAIVGLLSFGPLVGFAVAIIGIIFSEFLAIPIIERVAVSATGTYLPWEPKPHGVPTEPGFQNCKYCSHFFDSGLEKVSVSPKAILYECPNCKRFTPRRRA